jgi:hypothetical protein
MTKTAKTAEDHADAPEQDAEPFENNLEELPDQPQVQKRIRDYFKWRALPWWICFLAGIFMLTKFQIVYNDSPCAVLGTQSPVTMSEIKRAFRQLSMCTHPDRLRGRLKRTPTAAEERRGEIIFNRASAAKDELSNVLRGKKKEVACYQGELELALLALFQQAGKSMIDLGMKDYWDMGVDVVWQIVTLESGIINTVLSLLWMMFLLKLVKQFFVYMWRLGILRMFLAVATTVIIGPIPTVVHFLFLPFLRMYVFSRELLKGLRSGRDDANDQKQNAEGSESPAAAPKVVLTPAMEAAAERNRELPTRGVKQRKKKETEEEKEKKREELRAGTVKVSQEEVGEEPKEAGGPMPEGIWKCVEWSYPHPLKARQNAANTVQFDLLLILTKPIIPLCMLIALGQVWNGLFSSLFIGHVLRRWVPQMSYEAHHLLCVFFGAAHTLLGVSASQVEEYANREGAKVLHLAWAWSFKDVLAVLHMCLLGATVTAMSSLGNEPSYAASFAAGLALRIALAQDSVRGLSAFTYVANQAEAYLKDVGVSLVSSEEVVAYSGDGIGDCGGGPFRMLFGESMAFWASRILKAWLLLIPLLSAAQWLLRTVHAGRMLGKRHKTTRFVQRVILFIIGLLQCIMLANHELNAANGVLGNFWIAMLFGCAGESLLSTYDVRATGPVRQIVFLLLFLLI